MRRQIKSWLGSSCDSNSRIYWLESVSYSVIVSLLSNYRGTSGLRCGTILIQIVIQNSCVASLERLACFRLVTSSRLSMTIRAEWQRPGEAGAGGGMVTWRRHSVRPPSWRPSPGWSGSSQTRSTAPLLV